MKQSIQSLINLCMVVCCYIFFACMLSGCGEEEQPVRSTSGQTQPTPAVSNTAPRDERLRVVYGFDTQKAADPLHAYRIELLRLALDQSGEPYELVLYSKAFSQAGRNKALEKGEDFNVAFMGTSVDFEARFLPARVPIFLGLGSGYRLFLIRRSLQIALRDVRTLEQLQAYKIGQGIGWSDIEILENAGLTVIQGSYQNLFTMVERGRFDLFSRGLFEIYGEYDQRAVSHPGLMVDESLLLVYPFVMYFFVNDRFPEIQKAIELGLQRAYADGSMKALLMSNPSVKAALERAQLSKRYRIDLPAKAMTAETEQAVREYTFEEAR